VTFLQMVVKNLMRQRTRTTLTVVGITLGIATVVALGTVTAGMKGTADEFVTSGGAQFIVAQQGAADLSFSRVPVEVVEAVAEVPGVAEVRGVQLEVLNVGSNPFFLLGGVDPELLAEQDIDLVAGAVPASADEVLLGVDAAADLGVGVGDTVELTGTDLVVSGTFDSEVVWEAGGGFAWLETVQAIGNKEGAVTLAYVTVESGEDPDAVAAAITDAVPEVVTISDSSEYGQVDQGFVLIDAANTAISLLAILIGGIGVMNTMVMAIFERTREIGILRAVGWARRRVLSMILLESTVLCLVAAVVGSAFGVGITVAVTQIPAVSGFVVPAYPWSVFLKAVAVALLVGVLGAVYPAVRATRLTPMEALRYE
jgi:putative ABC transport system permease protein